MYLELAIMLLGGIGYVWIVDACLGLYLDSSMEKHERKLFPENFKK
jgi:hypothetical protein